MNDGQIISLVKKFGEFLKTSQGQKWEKERKEREKRFQELFQKDRIKTWSKEEFHEIISSLWASNFWNNKDWLVNKIIEDNRGLDNLKRNFDKLLYGNEPFWQRYDDFVKNTKRIGPSMLTEILTFIDPENFAIWNDKPKVVLPYLGLDKKLPKKVFKYPLTGKDYEKCIEVLSSLKEPLKAVIPQPDFIDVDFFLAYVYYHELPQETSDEGSEEKQEVEPTQQPITHGQAQKMLVELGKLLGYDTYVPPEDYNKKVNGETLGKLATLKDIPPFATPKAIETAKHIDVIWFDEEYPRYCFEVEDSTDVIKGLLRLYQIRHIHMTPVIVGPASKRSKFEREVDRDPFHKIKNRYRFISYEELKELFEAGKKFFELKKTLLE